MNIKENLKKKIIKDVLRVYKADWSVLVYDKAAGEIMVDLFTKSELNDHTISEAFLIGANKPEWDFPAVYFVAGTNANYDIINKEFNNKTFSKYCVVTIEEIDPVTNLNSLIKVTNIKCNIRIQEERIFLASANNACLAMEFILDTKFTIYKMPCIKHTLPFSKADEKEHVAEFLFLDRSFDLFTPLLHFFTFRSVLAENGSTKIDDGSKLYKSIRYRHMADVHKVLQYNINKLNENMEKLNKNLSTSELSKMVLDAPENIKLKASVEKYSNFLRQAFDKLENLQERISEDENFCSLIESEMALSTGEKNGKAVTIDLSMLFDLLASARLHKTDKLRLLYLIKYRGVSLTVTERSILKQSGYSAEDIDLKIKLDNKYKRTKQPQFKYDISRFEPLLVDIVNDCVVGDFKSYLVKANNLQARTSESEKHFSLRKTAMLTIRKKDVNRRKVVVYIRNGITYEECRLAYDLSDALGIDLILGSDRMLEPGYAIDLIKKKYAKRAEREGGSRS